MILGGKTFARGCVDIFCHCHQSLDLRKSPLLSGKEGLAMGWCHVHSRAFATEGETPENKVKMFSCIEYLRHIKLTKC